MDFGNTEEKPHPDASLPFINEKVWLFNQRQYLASHKTDKQKALYI